MTMDRFGNPVTGTDAAALQGIDDFVHGFVSYQSKAVNILKAAEAAPDCCLVQCYAAMLWMFLESPEAPARAAAPLHRAETLAPDATPREAALVRLTRFWAEGRIPELLSEGEALAHAHPSDLVLIKLLQYHHFNLGDAPAMLRVGLHLLPQGADLPYVHGMIAFGYEQCHLLPQAEASARRALEIEPTDPWAHHALAHVFLTQGRVDEGIVFLEGVAPSWVGLNSFMRSHNWWHLALFYLSRGRHDAVRAAYDTHVWGLSKDYSQDQVGAASLLARMELAGVDVGDRWSDLAQHVGQRGADTVQPFLTMQYLYALARADMPQADALMAAVDARATSDAFDAPVWADVAMPACQGLLAHARGDFETCVQRLGRALPRIAETGGSHAQRDLFEQIHLDALMQTGRLAQAQQALELRRSYDPDGVPVNTLLAQVYRKVGLGTLAQEAEARRVFG